MIISGYIKNGKQVNLLYY